MISSNKRRSIVFYRNAYYYFYYLAKALRRRGWDAITVSVDDPNSKIYQLYHGEDVNLFSSDPYVFRENIDRFFNEAINRFDMVYFQGDHCLSFYPDNFNKVFPPDLAKWISKGKKIGYISSGCLSGISQTSITDWSFHDNGNILCNKCIYKNNGNVCSDYRNLNWGRKFNSLCDIVSGVYLPAIDYMAGTNVFYDPLDIAMDSNLWSPGLEIPNEYYLPKDADEIILFHAMGNYYNRTKDKINIKGTSAIIEAVEKLRDEGIKCRMIFKTDIDNYKLRYFQAQADIIIEQLNFGRMGATSREGLMLGKPVITYLNHNEPIKKTEHESMLNNPVVSATEDTIYQVLKSLCLDKQRRVELAEAGRKYALRWFDADACAERFEKVYDMVMNQGRYNNGIYNAPEYHNIKPEKDIFDYYIGLSKEGKYSSDKEIESFTTDLSFKLNWGKYLEAAWLSRKVSYYIKKRSEAAICKFGELFELALIELEFGKDSEALCLLEKAQIHFNTRSEQFQDLKYESFLFLLAKVELRIRNFEKYLKYLLEAVKINDEFTEALFSLSEIYFKTNHLPQAKSMLEKAYLSQPSDNILLDNLKIINKKLGLQENHISMLNEWVEKKISESEELISRQEFNKAKEILEKIELVFPGSTECQNDLAVIEIMLEELEKATGRLKYILTIDPGNEVALENLKYVKELNYNWK